jgi:glycosyltransferase involved in cell wall biosynthesis
MEELYRRVCAEVEKVTSDFEIAFVNGGSPDNSLEFARLIQESDPRMKVVDLSRNFGQPMQGRRDLNMQKRSTCFSSILIWKKSRNCLPSL